MEKPKFKIGDVVLFVGNNGINIAKINAIILTKDGGIDYYFDGYDEYSKREADLTLYQEETADDKQKSLPELPKKWEDVKKYVSNRPSDNILSFWAEICKLIETTEDYAPTEFWKHIKLMQLILLRDIYRRGWKPDCADTMTDKFDIRFVENNLYPSKSSFVSLLSFQTEKIRDLFFENFKDLIEECKEFIN